MATMLNGATIMDGAFLLIAAKESFPQPQTLEHLSAVDVLRLQNIVILQNKVDLVTEVEAKKQHEAIQGLMKGVLKVNQLIELRPGIVGKDASGNCVCCPIYTRVVSLFAEQNELQFAAPGGLIGIGTTIDPTLSRGDRLVGQILGDVGTLPEVFSEIEASTSATQLVLPAL